MTKEEFKNRYEFLIENAYSKALKIVLLDEKEYFYKLVALSCDDKFGIYSEHIDKLEKYNNRLLCEDEQNRIDKEIEFLYQKINKKLEAIGRERGLSGLILDV
jgi:hypothetical protein